jgi:hypothetical protein
MLLIGYHTANGKSRFAFKISQAVFVAIGGHDRRIANGQ